MGVHHQYYPKKYANSSSTRLLHLTIPATSSFLYDKNDCLWNNPTELDLLNVKKAPIMTTTTITNDDNHFLKVLPCIRRLYTVFNSICPNIYRIHCSDSLRILQELICLIEDYLHIQIPLTITINELLYNEEYLDDLINKLRLSPLYDFYSHRNSSKSEIRCFGQEIPQYELEGDGCSKKVILNSINRFRLRIINSYSKLTIDAFSISILDPFGHKIVVQRRLLSSDLLELTYQPMSIGEHQLSILFNNKLDRQLIIDVINDETNYISKLKPFGPGLQRAIVGLPTEFYVYLNQPVITNNNFIQFCLEPSYQAVIDYEQQIATVRYTPLKQGDCPIHILEDNKDILHSPFIAKIKQEFILNGKPRIQVIGLTKQIIIHRPVEFQVLIDNSFDDPIHLLHIEVLTDENSPSVSIKHHDNSSYICSFIPTILGQHIISIDYAGIIADNNPFYCQSIQDKDIQLTGPAINNQCLILNQPTYFYFKLKDFLIKNSNETNSTYESGYSSNEETSLNSSLTNETKDLDNINENNYQVTITDGHGNKKSNISIKEINENLNNNNNNIRVDFTPDEQILFINISCTW